MNNDNHMRVMTRRRRTKIRISWSSWRKMGEVVECAAHVCMHVLTATHLPRHTPDHTAAASGCTKAVPRAPPRASHTS